MAAASATSASSRSSASRSRPGHARGQKACSISRARSESRASSSRCSACATAACSAGAGAGARPARARVRRRLPLAHEVADRLGVAVLVGLVEPLHERLGVRAAGLVAHEVRVHALGRVAEQRLEIVGRRRAGRRGDRAQRGRRLAEALLGGVGRVAVVGGAGARGDERQDARLELLHLHVDDADAGAGSRTRRRSAPRAASRARPRARRAGRAGGSGAAADKVDQAAEDALAVDAQPVVVVLAGHPARAGCGIAAAVSSENARST